MGKKKGSNSNNNNSKASLATPSVAVTKGGNKAKTVNATTAQQQQQQQSSFPYDAKDKPLYAVIEFHHMLIGNAHKKEAAALNAAATHGIVGCIFMGGPCLALVEAPCGVTDLAAWLTDCKKGWQRRPLYLLATASSSIDNGGPATTTTQRLSQLYNKLKVMPYAPGKDTKMDMTAYKAALAQVGIPFPLPPCAPLLLLL